MQATARQVVNSGTPETTYYVYDAGGQRVRKVTERQAAAGATPTRMKERIYLGGFEIYREYDTDGSTVSLERETLHVMDGQQRIALVETRTQGDDGSPAQLIRYQLGNHLGSASLELDEDGQIISYEEYYPYGSTSYQATDSTIKAAAKRYRYTGKERDESTGLFSFDMRYLSTAIGRWISCDPAGIGAPTSLYTYVRNRPTTLVDPNGLQDVRFAGQAAYLSQLEELFEAPSGGLIQVNIPQNRVDYLGPTSRRGCIHPYVSELVTTKAITAMQGSENIFGTSLYGIRP